MCRSFMLIFKGCDCTAHSSSQVAKSVLLQVTDYWVALVGLCLAVLGSVHTSLRDCWLVDCFFNWLSCFLIKGQHTGGYTSYADTLFGSVFTSAAAM